MDPFIGTIVQFGGSFAPQGWSFCDGQLLAISQYNSLFSLIGTTYGGDGRSTFALPDLRGRAALHPGTGPGLSSFRLGQKAGAEHYTITENQLASHTHTSGGKLLVNNGPGDQTTDPKSFAAMSSGADSGGAAQDIKLYGPAGFNEFGSNNGIRSFSGDPGNTGGGQPVKNIQPFQCVNFIIAMVGIYPSRS